MVARPGWARRALDWVESWSQVTKIGVPVVIGGLALSLGLVGLTSSDRGAIRHQAAPATAPRSDPVATASASSADTTSTALSDEAPTSQPTEVTTTTSGPETTTTLVSIPPPSTSTTSTTSTTEAPTTTTIPPITGEIVWANCPSDPTCNTPTCATDAQGYCRVNGTFSGFAPGQHVTFDCWENGVQDHEYTGGIADAQGVVSFPNSCAVLANGQQNTTWVTYMNSTAWQSNTLDVAT